MKSFKDFGSRCELIDEEKLTKKCTELESRWQELQKTIPERLVIIQRELDSWVRFNRNLELFKSWLGDAEDIHKEWKIKENSEKLIKCLEVH